MNLLDKNALVTGGASGLGEATVSMLLENGANVLVIDLNEDSGYALEKEFKGKLKFIKADVSNEVDIKLAIKTMIAQLGSIDIAVNCAGIAPVGKTVGKFEGTYEAHPLELFEKTIRINLIGTFNVVRLVAYAMEQNTENESGERGVIINTASVAAYDGQIGQVAYAASKAAIAGMTLPIARDLSRNGIRVMAIAPGLFETPLMSSLPEEARNSLGQQVPFPSRLGYPSEYAMLVKSIIENPMLNGEVIRLDGAIRMGPR